METTDHQSNVTNKSHLLAVHAHPESIPQKYQAKMLTILACKYSVFHSKENRYFYDNRWH